MTVKRISRFFGELLPNQDSLIFANLRSEEEKKKRKKKKAG